MDMHAMGMNSKFYMGDQFWQGGTDFGSQNRSGGTIFGSQNQSGGPLLAAKIGPGDHF